MLSPTTAIWKACESSIGEPADTSSSTLGCMCCPLGSSTRSVGLGEVSSNREYRTSGPRIAALPVMRLRPRVCPLCSPSLGPASVSGGLERFWRGIDCGGDWECRGEGFPDTIASARWQVEVRRVRKLVVPGDTYARRRHTRWWSPYRLELMMPTRQSERGVLAVC